MIRHALAALGLLLCMSATPMTCGSNSEPTSGSGGFTKTAASTTVKVGLDYRVHGNDPNKKVDITNTTGRHIKGCIVFRDANGNVLHKTPGIIPAGGTLSVPIPAGAATQEVTDEEDCGNRAPGAPGPQGAITARSRDMHFHQGAVLLPRMDGAPNVEHFITGRANDTNSFVQSALALVRGSYAADFNVQQEVTELDCLLSETVVLSGGDIVLTVASNHPFQTAQVWVNGTLAMNESSAVAPAIVGVGWSALAFTIPATLSTLNYDSTPGNSWENRVEVRFTRAGESALYNLMRTVEFTSN